MPIEQPPTRVRLDPVEIRARLTELVVYCRTERESAYNAAGLATGRAKQDIPRSRAVAMGDAGARARVLLEDLDRGRA